NQEEAFHMLTALGAGGRSFYLTKILPLDFPFPFAYMLFYAGWIALLLKHIASRDWQKYLLIIPVLAMLYDWMENLGIIILLNTYPNLPAWAVLLASVAGILKLIFIVVSIAVICLLFIAFLVKKQRLGETNMAKHHVCPWRGGPLLTASLRKLVHNPRRIVGPYLSEGMTAMDIGSGMGFFTIPIAGMLGKQGKVIAVDLQPEMLAGLQKNAQKAGSVNVTAHQCGNDSLNIRQWDSTVDFVLIFMMLHEVPDADRLIREVYEALAPDGKLLFSEPIVHVGHKKFRDSVAMIKQSGFRIIATPKINLCRSVVFQAVKGGHAYFEPMVSAYQSGMRQRSGHDAQGFRAEFYKSLSQSQRALFGFFAYYDHAIRSTDEFRRITTLYLSDQIFSIVKRGAEYFEAESMQQLLSEIEETFRVKGDVQSSRVDELYDRLLEIAPRTLTQIGIRIKENPEEFIYFMPGALT
ncbi:MAG: class I SAM-dependent methyltransferase, partial [Clostridiales bacterium]|nr:class I SAM-dependent methyltransferase [Clostridiales bacterium]